MAEKLTVGRPPKYKTVEEMIILIDDYFESVSYEIDGKKFYKPTMSGLAFALNLSRSGLQKYKVKKEFVHTIKRAKQIIEIALETGLYGQSVAGLIFNLKNNFGWADKQEIAHDAKEGSGVMMVPNIASMSDWNKMVEENEKDLKEKEKVFSDNV